MKYLNTLGLINNFLCLLREGLEENLKFLMVLQVPSYVILLVRKIHSGEVFVCKKMPNDVRV